MECHLLEGGIWGGPSPLPPASYATVWNKGERSNNISEALETIY